MDTQSMANRTKALPFRTRVQKAIAALFATKGDLAAPDSFVVPATIDKRRNALVEQFARERAVLWDFARAHAIKQDAEHWYNNAKSVFCEVFNLADEKLEAGYEVTITRDDVSCLVKVTKPQHRLDRSALRTALMLECKLTAEKADALLKKCEKAGKPPVYLTPTVNE